MPEILAPYAAAPSSSGPVETSDLQDPSSLPPPTLDFAFEELMPLTMSIRGNDRNFLLRVSD